VTLLLGDFDPVLRDALTVAPEIRVLLQGAHPQPYGRAHVVLVHEAIGYAGLMQLKASQPGAAIVVFARDPSELYGELLLSVGASSLAQGLPVVDVAAAVGRVRGGECLFISVDGRCVVSQDRVRVARLTRREREIFDRLRARETDGAIALALQISPETVRKHTARIRRKLGLRSKREIVSWPTSAP
jgi:DNA-binding NarL/FixJ family response regulator